MVVIVMVFFMQDESHSQEPGPSTSVQTAPVRYPPPPQRTVQRETKETQTLVFDDKEKCRMCGEGELDKRALWVGSSQPKCDYWVHVCCLHIKATSQRSLTKIAWYCPQHWGSEIN